MSNQPMTFCEIVRRALGRRIIQLRFANTLSYGDIRKVMIQLDSGEWLEVGGMPGLAISLVPLSHPDTAKLSVGGEEDFVEPLLEGCTILERIYDAATSLRRAFKWAARAPTRPPWPGNDKQVCEAREELFKLLRTTSVSACHQSTREREWEVNKAQRRRLNAVQEAIDQAYSLLRERHDPCWLMNRAERILNPHRTK